MGIKNFEPVVIGRLIEKKANEQQVTAYKIAKKTGISTQQVYNIMKGKTNSTAQILSKVLKCVGLNLVIIDGKIENCG